MELHDRLPALNQSGKVNIVLNLKDVSHIDSTGLRTLVFRIARLRKTGGRLALLNVNPAHSFLPDPAVKHIDILDFVQREEIRVLNHHANPEAAC